MAQTVPFLAMFPFLGGNSELCGGLDKASVSRAIVKAENRSLTIHARFAVLPAMGELNMVKSAIAKEFALAEVDIVADYPKPETAAKPAASTGGGGGDLLMGRAIKGTPVPMSTIDEESSRSIVEGDVIAVSSRELRNGNAVLTFDITDKTNALRVSKYLKRGEESFDVFQKIEVGDHLIVQGDIGHDKYVKDYIFEPRSIMRAKKQIRPDNAEEKRVELHLHTRFSAMDALTDPGAVVKRAAAWGMPAIAVTDHGVAQAFPDMWKAGKKHGIKIIYGIECYFQNDLDGNNSVIGNSKLPYDTEYVAFDLETTGLNAENDRVIEIGAVRFCGETIKESFSTFVNPGREIPDKITELTGIRNSDVEGAPDEETAVRDFLAFVGSRPLAAHNASFDVGFISNVCRRHDIRFKPVAVDTLPLAQSLLPDMKQYKLDHVSNHLGLPKFNHHRATDDALVVARILAKFMPMLKLQGAKTIDDIESISKALRKSEKNRTYHMTLLATNRKGLKNMYELISQSYLTYFYRNPIVPKSLLVRHREGLLIGSACEAGELYGAVLKGAPDPELEAIAEFYDYLEIQPICNNAFLIAEQRVADESVLQDYNRKILELGRKLGKPVIAASDVHFLDPEDELYRHILLASKKFKDADKSCPIYFRTTEEMLQEFAYLGEETAYEVVVTNTRAIADMVEPMELLPKDLFPPKIENSAEQLKQLVYEKMHRIYGALPPEVVQKRVDVELNTILDHHYDVIYMSAQKLVQNSLEHGYLVGSRGSVGSSIVAYMSGITEVNSLPPHYVCPNCTHSEFENEGGFGCGADMPEKACPECGTMMRREGFDIPFETFLGYPGNEKTPDIDLNFSGEYQGKAHKYTEVLFGSDHVFRAGTIGTLADKTAYGYVLKYLEEHPEMHATEAEKNRLAQGLVGVKRTTGQHPGGLVIIPQDMDVTDFCPVQHPADDPDSDIITTHFEYHCMEDNLLKLDELGHDDPTMIRMMEDMTGLDAKEISLSDPDTMSIFTSPKALGLMEDDTIIGKTGTIGVPEFGTNFTRQMLVDTQPNCFDTLVRLSGFSHGTDVWAGNIHDLIVNGIATVNETVGCRDDIMLYLIAKGMQPSLAFKTMEAVRKGKVKKSGSFPGDAEEQMRGLGVPEWYIESCRKIAYLFPKAHAVAYVMMAFRIAWFKVHYPIAFYSAYFYRRSQKGGFDAAMMTGGTEAVRRKINELHRAGELTANQEDLLVTLEAVYEFNMRGFTFAPISLFESDAIRFLPVGDKQLRPPFKSVAGLGEAAALDLQNCRGKEAEIISIDDVSRLCPKVSGSILDTLKDMGALGDLPDSNQITLFEM